MTNRLAPALLLLLLLPAAPTRAAADGPNLPDLPIESYRLPNGLKVVLHRDSSVPRVTVCVAYHVGSKDERARRTGFAHFFEHMMFRGTKNVPNFDIPLQETGGQSNAFTNEDVTVYHETIPSSYLERALYLESERLAFLPSALDQEKFDTEREVVKEERRQSYENVPYGLAEETILANVFPRGNPYSWSVIGAMADLNSASLKDLKRFFLEYYHPGNACLCLSGDFDPAAAKALIARYFGPLAASPKTIVRPEVAQAKPRDARVTLADRVSLPRVYWAWPTIRDDHPDSPALDLLAKILTDGDASRLKQALVIDGRVAEEVAAESETKEAAGLFTLHATAAEGKSLGEVEAALLKEFDRLKAQPPTEGELRRALAMFEMRNYARLTPPLNRAYVLAIGFLEKDDPAYYRRDLARYFQVTPADLARVAATYLVPQKVAVEVVPMAPGKPKSAAVQAGPASADPSEAEIAERAPAKGPDWSTLPGPTRAGEFRAPAFVRRTLSNGIEVWVAPWRTLPVVNARLIVGAGSGDDPEGKAGLAQLNASLLTQGSKDKTTRELAEALEALGVRYACSADSDDTALVFSVLSRNLDPALALLAPMFAAPRLDPADFARERDLQLAGLLQGPDRVNWIAQRAFRALLYGQGHPYGRPTDGRAESVKAITLDDVRAFHASRFAPGRAKLIASGDVDPDALVAMLETHLGRWSKQGTAPGPRPTAASGADPGVIYLVDKPGAVQSVIRVGRRWAPKGDPRNYATAVGNHVFGVDFLSRLNKNLREKNGYTYGIRAAFVDHRADSVWASGAAVRADVTGAALKEILDEFGGVAGARPLSADELALGRDAVARSFPEGFEDPASIVGLLEEVAVLGLPGDYLATFIDRIRAVPDDRVRAVFGDLARPRDQFVLVVGDRATIEPQLKALNLGEVRLVDPDGKPVSR